MVREIKNKVTILHTADDSIGIRNKLGCPGISRYNNTNRWRSEISIGPKKYLIGVFEDIQDAINARKVAEVKKEAGCLVQWLASKPHGNSEECMDFWKKQFEGIDQNENS